MNKIETLTAQINRLNDRREYLMRAMRTYPERSDDLHKVLVLTLKDIHILKEEISLEKNMAWVDGYK